MYHHITKMLESMKTAWRSWISSANHVDMLEIRTGFRIFTFAVLLYAHSGFIQPSATTSSGQIYHRLNPLLYFPPWDVSSPCESSAMYERTANGISEDERVRTHTILNIAHVRRGSSCCVRTWLSGEAYRGVSCIADPEAQRDVSKRHRSSSSLPMTSCQLFGKDGGEICFEIVAAQENFATLCMIFVSVGIWLAAFINDR